MPLCPPGYDDLGPLAVGASASVRRIQQQQTIFALKRLHAHLLQNAEARALFDDETFLGLRLRHPCLVPVLAGGEDELGPYQIQEYAAGPTLAALLQMSPSVEPPIACRIAADIAAGLSFAHGLAGDDGQVLGLVHRDLNPSNIIVTVRGLSRVIDFGVAWFRGARAPRAVRGTPAYLSPEQARGEELTRASDLFALGAILFELVTGNRAFPGAEPSAIATIGREHIPSLQGISPAPLATILRALLAPLARRAKEAGNVAAALSSLAAPHAEVVALLRRVARR